MNKFNLIIRLVKAIIRINQFNNVHSNYHRQAKILVDKITAPFNFEAIPNIPSNTKLKMQWYMAECLYTCENFNKLSGQKSTLEQRKMYLLSGALVAMCDLIIDDIEMDTELIKLLKSPTKNFIAKDKIQELYLACYEDFIDSLEIDVKQETIEYFELLFDAQLQSKKQFDPNLSRDDTDEICKNKCGYTMLFLRAMVKGKTNSIENEAWFELGALVQYCNDAQDLHKDLQKKMRTFASTRPDLNTIAIDIDKQKTKAFTLIKKTSFQEENKDYLLFVLHIMCIAILSKLHSFYCICNHNFSFDKFLSKSKKEVRTKTSFIRLVKYWFPRVINYHYETVETPYQFEYNLTNKNISTTKNEQIL